MEDYFELTDKGLIINDATIMLVDSFNEVYKRDLSTNKEQAFKELHYIFQICDIRSTSIKKGLKNKQLIADAKKIAKLDKNWKADAVINHCIKYWKDDNSNIIITSYENLLQAFGSMNATVTFLDDVVRTQLAKIQNAENSDTITDDDSGSLLSSDTIKIITSSIRELLTLATDIPKKVQELESIKEKALSINKDKSIGRSGIEITDSMNPMSSVTNR